MRTHHRKLTPQRLCAHINARINVLVFYRFCAWESQRRETNRDLAKLRKWLNQVRRNTL